MILFKKVFRGTFKNIAESFKIIIFYSLGLIVDKFIKILIAKTKLNIKTILGFFFYKAGIVTGDARTRLYRPEDNLTRAETCVIFTRIAVSSMRVSSFDQKITPIFTR